MRSRWNLALVAVLTLAGCEGTTDAGAAACDSEPVVRTTADGVEFVRTPDACFDSLPGWPYGPRYVELDGLRQAYVDEGPTDGQVVLLLHGQPSWSYLYRKMIPILVDAGFRVIAMDHLGMGRSDKPTNLASYSYLGHVDRLERFIEDLGLRDIHLFVQDWGSLIGLHVVGTHPEWFAQVSVGDGTLPVLPAGVMPYPEPEDPDELTDATPPFLSIPPQQPAFYEGCEPIMEAEGDYFGEWIAYAMTGRDFRASQIVEVMTYFDLPEAEEAAYDAPFPSRIYMAGPRVFPSLVNDLPGVTEEARAGLDAYERPLSTIWADNDPGNLGQCATQEDLMSRVRGAAGQMHTRLAEASHFLQDDQGEAIAEALVHQFSEEGVPLTRESRYCELLIARNVGGALEAEVWGTQGLNDCPADAWEALDPAAIQAEEGALAVIMNGPRQWMVDATLGERSDRAVRTFGGITMRRLAVVEIDGMMERTPYTALTVRRRTTYAFHAGEEIYQLTDPDGAVYTLQAMSQIVDPDLTPSDLPDLGARLMLPDGWSFAARTLDEPLILRAEGEVTVIQDDLLNTYQRVGAGDGPGPSPLPVLVDGTGTLCASADECAGLDASHCLTVSEGGFCTIEGCAPGGCGAPYVCCHSCDEAFASFLPFEGSACIPGDRTAMLEGTPSCTCE